MKHKDWQVAMHVWYYVNMRSGVTLPMLGAFRAWLNGENVNAKTAKKRALEIHKEVCATKFWPAKGLPPHREICNALKLYHANSFCGTIRELVLHPCTEGDIYRICEVQEIASRYDFIGVSKVRDVHGNYVWATELTPQDIGFFKQCKQVMDEEK